MELQLICLRILHQVAMLYGMGEFDAIWRCFWVDSWQSTGEKNVHNAMPRVFHDAKLSTVNRLTPLNPFVLIPGQTERKSGGERRERGRQRVKLRPTDALFGLLLCRYVPSIAFFTLTKSGAKRNGGARVTGGAVRTKMYFNSGVNTFVVHVSRCQGISIDNGRRTIKNEGIGSDWGIQGPQRR